MGVLIMLNNFFHDLSVAVMIASLSGAILVSKSKAPGIEAIRLSLFRLYHGLLMGSMAGIILFGIVRAIYFKEFEWVNALGRNQLVALAVKHVIMAGATVAGIVYLVRLRRRSR